MKQQELERQLDKVHDWIKSVDQKISIAIAFELGIFALLVNPTFKLLSLLFPSLSLIVLFTLAFVVGSFLFAIVRVIWALKPRIKMPKGMESLIFFESIAQMSFFEYSKRLNDTTSKDYLEDTRRQIHTSSYVASRKHTALAESLYGFVAGIFFWVVFALLAGFELIL